MLKTISVDYKDENDSSDPDLVTKRAKISHLDVGKNQLNDEGLNMIVKWLKG